MADHLTERLFLKDGDVVEVVSDTQANVILMDDWRTPSTKRAVRIATTGASLLISRRD